MTKSDSGRLLPRIVGSERFSSRGASPDDLLADPPAGVTFHTVTADQVAAVDRLTYEVIRHRIWSITDEMADVIKRMSGSIVVTDANDFDFAVSDERGQSVQIALYNTELAACVDLAIVWTLKHRAANPGVDDGDMFLSNDPWVGGGLHQNDVSLIQPIFWEGKLFAWTSAIAHQMDLGGVSPGSRSPRADSVFWEALPTPPLKIVRHRRIQSDVEDAYVRRSRTPGLVSLDLRAKFGANLLARERILQLIKRYGVDTVKAVMKRMMDDAEEQLRAKLRRLPDGVWNATQYIDSSGQDDRGVYNVEMTMTKRDDRLTFDVRRSSRQTGMINCTWAGCRGGVIAAILPILAGEIPWSPGGLLRCVELITEPGTIVDAEFPSAIGKAPVGPAMATSMAAVQCLSKMLNTDPELSRDTISVCSGTANVALFAGTQSDGTPFMTAIAEHMATGLGARSYRDGVDTGGHFSIPMGRVPDAEMNEFKSPLLYIWRREEIDSGGPGRYRGGLSGSALVVPHGTRGPISCVVSGAGKAVAQNVGTAGGYPGNLARDIIIRNADVKQSLARGEIPQSFEQIDGTFEPVPSEHQTGFTDADAYFMQWQAGGGYMDPLLREPRLVAGDVGSLKVSPEAAKEVYGVVLDGATGQPDEAATRAQRSALRRNRAALTRTDHAPTVEVSVDGSKADHGGEVEIPARVLSENFALRPSGDNGQSVSCKHCGTIVADDQERLLSSLLCFDDVPAAAGPQIGADPAAFTDTKIVFRQFVCPGCYTAVISQLVPASRVERQDVVEFDAVRLAH
jgi:N-methylhydantoinase B